MLDIHAFVRLPDRFFRSIGLVPFHLDHPPPATPAWMRVHFALCCLMLGVCVVGEAVQFVKVAPRPEYFVQAAAVFLYFGFNVLSYAKTFTVLAKRPLLSRRIVQPLAALFPRTPAVQAAYRVRTFVRLARRLIVPYSVFQMLMIWFFNLFPTVEAVYGWALGDGRWRIDFPYENWYPIDAYRPGWFELCYVSQLWGSYFAAAGALAADLLLCSLAVQVCMHCEELSGRLRQMRPRGAGRWRRTAAAECVAYAELRDCIRRHVRIIGISQSLDDVFNVCILFNVMSSVCIVCMLGFLVTTSNETIALVKFAMALFTCAVQVFLISVFGDMFTASSVGVADACCENEWYNGSRRFKRALQLLMLRAQRPLHLTAYKYTSVSMVMFKNVMSTSWQFFVLISSVYDD